MESNRYQKTAILVACGILLAAIAGGLSAPKEWYWIISVVVLIGFGIIWRGNLLPFVTSAIKLKRKGKLGSTFEDQHELVVVLGANPSEVSSIHHIHVFLRKWMSNPDTQLPKRLSRKRNEVVTFLVPYGRAKAQEMGNSIFAHLHRKGFNLNEIAMLSNSNTTTITENLASAGLIE